MPAPMPASLPASAGPAPSALQRLGRLARPVGLLALAWLAAAPAWADLMLYPTRLVMENRQRAAQVELVNRGQKPETYRIRIVNRRMSETGQILDADSPAEGERFATELLRYSPRQVTLQPGQSQTVRVSVRRPAGLDDGEYRSHLQFDRQPDAEGGTDLEVASQTEPGQIAIRLTALIGASIPVIVRHGDTQASVTLEQLAIEQPPTPEGATAAAAPLLSFRMNRQGNRSVYGNLRVSYTPPGGQPVEVGQVNGVAVYVPNALRVAKMPLRLPEGLRLSGGELSLSYLQRPEDGGQPLARASLSVPAAP